jgi:hypothetical protein
VALGVAAAHANNKDGAERVAGRVDTRPRRQLKKVKEGNEKNNRRCGKFSGSVDPNKN